jgi:hypothetical protein
MPTAKGIYTPMSGFRAVWWRVPWSIRGVIRKDVADWISSNSFRRPHPLTWLDTQLLTAAENPRRLVASLVIAAVAVWVLAFQVPSLQVLVPQWQTEQWAAAEELSYFTALWSVQATLAALVYPIVIAFVAVFLQRRPAAESLLHLYLISSGGVVAGLSSLILVLTMSAQYFALPLLGAAGLPSWAAVDAGWFCINVAMTALFLYRTIDFLRPETQLDVVRRYVANVVFPREVERLLGVHVLLQAQEKKWISGREDPDDPRSPTVSLHGFGLGDGEAQGKLVLSRSRLYDVRLWLLRVVAESWVKAARDWPGVEPEDRWQKRSHPELTIPFVPGRAYEGETKIAFVEAGPPLRSWQRFVLRKALVFRKVSLEHGQVKLQDLLAELAADAKEAALKQDDPTFARAYDGFVGMHELLLGCALFVAEDGSRGSFALLQNVDSWFSRELNLEWQKHYRSIFEATIGIAGAESGPLERVCHVVQHVGGDALTGSPEKVRQQILGLPPLLMYLISEWWAKEIEQQGDLEHGPHQAATLRAPLQRTYDDILRQFVAGWESARTEVSRIPDAAEFRWASAADHAELHASHMQHSARMFLAAVLRGDRAAAEWLGDALMKWWGSYDFDREPLTLLDRSSFITIDDMKRSWSDVYESLNVSESETWDAKDSPVLQRAVLMAAIQNFWIDVRLLTLELLLWTAHCADANTCAHSLAMEVACAMLNGRTWKGGGEHSLPDAGYGAPAYLLAKVRQYASGGSYREGYIGRLDSFVGSVKDMERPKMVSGRIYSFSGADDVASLQAQQLTLLVLFSQNAWTPNSALLRQIDFWLSGEYECIAVLRGHLDRLIAAFPATEVPTAAALSMLKACTKKAHDDTEGLTRARDGIEELRRYVEQHREEAIAQEPIDVKRLRQLGMYASSKAFSASTGEFPLALFGHINFGARRLNDWRFVVSAVRKGELTATEMDQRVSNEEDYWARTMADLVGRVVLNDVLQVLSQRDALVPEPMIYWDVLKSEAQRIISSGQHPVLVLDNSTRPDWIWEWQHASYGRDKYPRPPDLVVRKHEGRGPRYVCDFNDIEVFSAPMAPGASLLVAREVFQALDFTEYEPGRLVDATPREREDSRLLIDLVMTISRQVTVHPSEAVLLRYSSDKK